MPPKSRPKARPKTTTKTRPKTTRKKQSKTKASKKRSTVNVNWAEKLGMTAPGAELRKDLGPLISQNLKPVFQVAPPVGNRRDNRPTLNESWEKAVKKGLRVVKQTKDYIEVRIPIEIRSLIPDMPTRMRLKYKELDIVTNKIDEFNRSSFGNPAPLQTPPGYVRKVRKWVQYWYGPDPEADRHKVTVKQNKMTNLQTFRQNRSGRITDMVRPGRKVQFQNMRWSEYHGDGGYDTEQEKRILRDGLLLVVVTEDTIWIKNKYFESGRGIQVGLRLTGLGYVIVEATIISKKQPRPEPRAPSTRPRKRRRNV